MVAIKGFRKHGEGALHQAIIFKYSEFAQVETLQRNKALYCVIVDLQFSKASNSAMTIRRKPVMNIWQYLLLHSVVKHLKTNKKVKVLFYQMLSTFRKNIAYCNVSRLRLFVLLLRATRVRRWIWRNGAMIMAGKPESLGGKPVPSSLCPPNYYATWPGIETRSPQWQAGDYPPETWRGI